MDKIVEEIKNIMIENDSILSISIATKYGRVTIETKEGYKPIKK
jgi:hypothetical protein